MVRQHNWPNIEVCQRIIEKTTTYVIATVIEIMAKAQQENSILDINRINHAYSL